MGEVKVESRSVYPTSYRFTGGGGQLPTANMAGAVPDTEKYSLFMQMLCTHSKIWGLVIVYDRIACLHLLNTVIWFTCHDICSQMVGKASPGWW